MRWFKKPLVLKFYTTNAGAYQTAKPKPAGSFVPVWWKSLPTKKRKLESIESYDMGDYTNMRGCVGMKHMYQYGAVIPMWCDMHVEISQLGTSEYRWRAADTTVEVGSHSSGQHNHYWNNHFYQHVKFVSPWHIVCEELTPFMFLDCYWSRNTQNQYTIPPGIVEYKYQHSAHINTFFSRAHETYSILIEHGQPMVQVVPLSDRPVKVETYLISPEELTRLVPLTAHRPTFVDLYKHNRRAIEKENQ